jgi:hypothetical protein
VRDRRRPDERRRLADQHQAARHPVEGGEHRRVRAALVDPAGDQDDRAGEAAHRRRDGVDVGALRVVEEHDAVALADPLHPVRLGPERAGAAADRARLDAGEPRAEVRRHRVLEVVVADQP